ncbi:MAG: response regulator [Chloroflexota bacterium]
MGDRSILVVDDDPDITQLVAFVLGEEGYRVRIAADGQEGLDAVGTELPDLILLDMKMPVMDGSEFAQRFRAAHDDAVPIVVLTAAADARKRAEEVGAQGWLGKPFSLDSLIAAVRRGLVTPRQ